MDIKGTAVKTISEFVKSKFEADYAEWFNNLDEKAQMVIRGPIYSTDWYPVVDSTIKPTEIIGKMFYEGDTRKAAWESGRYSAGEALTGVYKFFVKASSPSFIISRASRIFSGYYRPCEMQVINKTNNSLILQVTSTEKTCDVLEARIGGWIQRALEISGCKEVTIDFPKSLAKGDDVTLFDIKW